MSEQCILSVIFINGYLWVMSADCDGAFKSFGHKGRVCVCKRHYRVIQHDSGCTLKGRGSHSCSHLAENCVSVPECLCECLCVWLCGQVIMSPLKKLLRFLVLATSRQNNTQPQQIWCSICGVKNFTASDCSDCRVDLSSCDLTHWFKDEEWVFLCLSFPEHHNYQITWGDGRVFKIPTNCPVLSTVV